jgi:hypothetical protein
MIRVVMLELKKTLEQFLDWWEERQEKSLRKAQLLSELLTKDTSNEQQGSKETEKKGPTGEHYVRLL